MNISGGDWINYILIPAGWTGADAEWKGSRSADLNEKRFGADRDVIGRRSDNRHDGRRRCQRDEFNPPPDGRIKCREIQIAQSSAQFLVFFQLFRPFVYIQKVTHIYNKNY